MFAEEVSVTDPGEQKVVGPPALMVGAVQVIIVNGVVDTPEQDPITTVT